MSPSKISINDLINDKKNLIFLVSAGCSIDPPSCQPAGNKMKETILKFLYPESEF